MTEEAKERNLEWKRRLEDILKLMKEIKRIKRKRKENKQRAKIDKMIKEPVLLKEKEMTQ